MPIATVSRAHVKRLAEQAGPASPLHDLLKTTKLSRTPKVDCRRRRVAR
jgi:hypothetical protein